MPRPQRPSAPRLFYYIHRDDFIIGNLVHTKADLNAALRVETNPAEYLKMENYIRGDEKRMLEVRYPVSTCIVTAY